MPGPYARRKLTLVYKNATEPLWTAQFNSVIRTGASIFQSGAMFRPQILLIALGPLLAGGSVIRRANDAYSFTIFQTTDCSNTQGNFTV